MARAWIPLVLPVGMILMGALRTEAKLVGNPSGALFFGALICLTMREKKYGR